MCSLFFPNDLTTCFLFSRGIMMWLLMIMKKPNRSLEKRRCKFSRNVRFVYYFQTYRFLLQEECGVYVLQSATAS